MDDHQETAEDSSQSRQKTSRPMSDDRRTSLLATRSMDDVVRNFREYPTTTCLIGCLIIMVPLALVAGVFIFFWFLGIYSQA